MSISVTVTHPTNLANFSELELGEVTVWFSYGTPIAFLAPGQGRVIRGENEWGPTTGKHLNWVAEGSTKADRISGDEFERRLEMALATTRLVEVDG